MNTAVGILLLVVGTLLFLTAMMLAVGEVISGRHSGKPRGTTMAGLDWKGISAVLNGVAAIFGALKDWPLAGLFMLFGVVLDGGGIYVLAAKPI